MSVKTILAATAALGLALAGLEGASAHHSFAMFDQSKKITLKGTVTEFQWTNPHSFLEIDAQGADGKKTHWSLELNSPNNLKRQGWSRNAVKPGDIVSVTFNPLRDGKPGGLFNSVVLPGGKVLAEAAFAGGKPVNTPGSN
ncbi:MAG: hypothetical protein J7498_13225 [Sphingobium sp.]|nr:hypothetical protein [Sphingobium sp.]